ncbi:MAG: hypothetical protein LBE81_09200 [Azonexus sp.]|jgi:hypothetical protein|uniref:DUF748 domain-containing protein n=1 Tax=Azonexus sp. TaxID=1872668 RepID=UPI002826C047|nr:hypothetical protein [Azonexus sp.]MDR0776797.1 hypothetical protein [Azonexus sp.]
MKKGLLLVVALVIVGAIVFFLTGNPLGHLVKMAIEEFGPKMTQAEVSVGAVSISASDGEGSIAGLKLGNPKGFKTDYALRADKIALSLEPSSLTKDVVLIRKIALDGPHIIYEKNSNGVTNFDAIQRNVEQYLGTSGSKDSREKSGDTKKMIIESFSVRNAKVSYSGLVDVDLNLPDIELRDIGKKTGGVDTANLAKVIISELNAQILKAVAKSVTDSVGAAADKAKDAFKGLLGK